MSGSWSPLSCCDGQPRGARLLQATAAVGVVGRAGSRQLAKDFTEMPTFAGLAGVGSEQGPTEAAGWALAFGSSWPFGSAAETRDGFE